MFVALALSLYCADFKGQTLEFLTEGTASRAEDHWISALNFDYFRTFGESEFWYKLSQLLEQALEEFSNHGYSPIVIALLTAFFGKLLRRGGNDLSDEQPQPRADRCA